MSIQISWRANTPGKSHRLTFKRGAVGICAALETFLDPDNVNGPGSGAGPGAASEHGAEHGAEHGTDNVKEGFPCHQLQRRLHLRHQDQDQIPDRVEFGPPKALIASLINPQGRYKLDPEWILTHMWGNPADLEPVEFDLYIEVRRLIKSTMPRQVPAGTVSVRDLVGEVS